MQAKDCGALRVVKKVGVAVERTRSFVLPAISAQSRPPGKHWQHSRQRHSTPPLVQPKKSRCPPCHTPPLRGPCTFVSTCTWIVCSQLAHHATSDCSTHLNRPEETLTANRLDILWRWEIAYMYVESHLLPAKRTREAIDIQVINNTVYHC
jgi:hypothetical protein